MKLEFRKDKLMGALNIVSKAIPAKTTNKLLECILFETKNDTINLMANDNELAISTIAEGYIEERGALALEAKLIIEIIRKLEGGDESIIIESNKDYITTIKSGDVVFNIQGFDPEEFSYLPEVARDRYISMSQFTLKEAIRHTIFASNPSDSNKMMGGELFEVRSHIAKFATLDGRRIALRNIELKDIYEDISCIIPVKTLGEIAKILEADNSKEVYIYIGSNHILFKIEDSLVVSRLIEGEYFRVDQMISRDYSTKLGINRSKFLAAIDRSLILIRENDNSSLIMDIKDDSLMLRVDASQGRMRSEIACDKVGNDLMIAFNPRFLIDALRAIDDEFVDLYFSNSKSPCIIKDENNSYLYLILPVNFIA